MNNLNALLKQNGFRTQVELAPDPEPVEDATAILARVEAELGILSDDTEGQP